MVRVRAAVRAQVRARGQDAQEPCFAVHQGAQKLILYNKSTVHEHFPEVRHARQVGCRRERGKRRGEKDRGDDEPPARGRTRWPSAIGSVPYLRPTTTRARRALGARRGRVLIFFTAECGKRQKRWVLELIAAGMPPRTRSRAVRLCCHLKCVPRPRPRVVAEGPPACTADLGGAWGGCECAMRGTLSERAQHLIWRCALLLPCCRQLFLLLPVAPHRQSRPKRKL